MGLVMQERALAPALRPAVLRATSFSERGSAPDLRVEAPMLGVVLLVCTGPRIDVDGARVGSFAAGLYDRPVVTGHGGEQAGVQLDLTLTGARRLLGVPMDELTNRTVALEDLLGPVVARAEQSDDPLAVLEAELARRLDGAPRVAPEVQHALRRIAATHGAVRVETIAREVGWSRRHLSARVRDAAGMAPKAVARLARAARAVELLHAPGAELGSVAYDCGYADQSHFTREVRAYTGKTPKEFPKLQDAPIAA